MVYNAAASGCAAGLCSDSCCCDTVITDCCACGVYSCCAGVCYDLIIIILCYNPAALFWCAAGL